MIEEKVKETQIQLNEFYNDIELIDAFLYGVEICGKDDVYSIRQRLFRLKGFILKKIK